MLYFHKGSDNILIRLAYFKEIIESCNMKSISYKNSIKYETNDKMASLKVTLVNF